MDLMAFINVGVSPVAQLRRAYQMQRLKQHVQVDNALMLLADTMPDPVATSGHGGDPADSNYATLQKQVTDIQESVTAQRLARGLVALVTVCDIAAPTDAAGAPPVSTRGGSFTAAAHVAASGAASSPTTGAGLGTLSDRRLLIITPAPNSLVMLTTPLPERLPAPGYVFHCGWW